MKSLKHVTSCIIPVPFLSQPKGQKLYLWTCVPSEDSDQPAYSRSLIRIFVGRILDSKVFFHADNGFPLPAHNVAAHL